MKKTGILILTLIVSIVCISSAYAKDQAQDGTDNIANTITAIVSKNMRPEPEKAIEEIEPIYKYRPNEVFKVYCMVNRIVDIQLQAGEELTYMGGPDSAQWVVDKDISGKGAEKQYHIFVKPQDENSSTNFVILTDKHTYHLEVYTRDFYTPIINWSYPLEEQKKSIVKYEEENKYNNNALTVSTNQNKTLADLNFNYNISKKRYAWKPTLVFDNGIQTYFKISQTIKETPIIFIKQGNAVAAINYQIKNGYYIVDRLGEAFDIRVGKKVVKIIRSIGVAHE